MSTKPAMNLYFLAILLLFSCGCANELSKAPQQVSAAKALEIAKREFQKVYPERILHYDISVMERSDLNAWNVWFKGKGEYAVPGGYTCIRIDKTTGKSVILPSE